MSSQETKRDDLPMKIILNGREQQVPDGANVLKMVEQFCQDTAPVIAEINGQIIRRPFWERSVLEEGDTVELVCFVGGG